VDTPTVRPARADDLPRLSQLARRTWSDAFGDSVTPDDAALELEKSRSETYFAAAMREQTILVAEGDDALLGYVQFGDVDIPDVAVRPGVQALHRLYVDAGCQGRGLGRRLMLAALQHPRLAAADRIYLTVWERNERALRLYESMGFRVVGTTTFTIGSGEIAEDLVLLLDKTARDRRTHDA
jgi:ribosomal protein S18 acetylase RimI-like enzyme